MLHRIVKLAASLPKLLREVPILSKGSDGVVLLSQLQAASLLSCSFLCLYNSPRRGMGGMNMNALFEERNIEKLKCILHYFGRVADDNYTPRNLLRFHRRCLRVQPAFESCRDVLFSPGVTVTSHGKIEDVNTKDYIHADFANKILGGGVLGHGLVQEGNRACVDGHVLISLFFRNQIPNLP